MQYTFRRDYKYLTRISKRPLMHTYLFTVLLAFTFNSVYAQVESIHADVYYFYGQGISSYVFSPAGDLVQASRTGGPTWRKDTVVRRVEFTSSDLERQVVTRCTREGERELLLERQIRRNGDTLFVSVDSYSPVIEVASSRTLYLLDGQDRIIESRMKGFLLTLTDYPNGEAIFTYSYEEDGSCVVTDVFTEKTAIEITPRKKRTVARIPGKGANAFELVFGLDGKLQYTSTRRGAGGSRTDFKFGNKGFSGGAMKTTMSSSGNPPPAAVWRLKCKNCDGISEELKGRLTTQILESVALQESRYRRFFPRGYAPAEIPRKSN